MNLKRLFCPGYLSALAAVMILATGGGLAEEAVGKWRFEIKLGGINPGDNILSDAANTTVVATEPTREIIRDPRPDISSTIEGRLASDPRLDVRASYGLKSFKNSELLLDVGIGIFRTRANNLEFYYSLDIQDPNYRDALGTYFESCDAILWATGQPGDPRFCTTFSQDRGGEFGREEWNYEPVNIGEFTQIPLSIGVMQRFRPTKVFNPYLGASLGYLFVDFEPSDRWRELSDQLDASYVDSVIKFPSATSASGLRTLTGAAHNLVRPRVEAEDTPFLEVKGGVEWQWRRKVAFFLETSFMWAQDSIVITVDGLEKFGVPVPDGIIIDEGPNSPPSGGTPAYIICGGVTPPDADEVPTNALCPGAGEYYFNGGKLDHGGFSWQAGVRFTL